MIRSTLVSFIALCTPALALAQGPREEIIYGFVTTPDTITFQVRSGGCTGKESFRLDVTTDNLNVTLPVLTLVRTKPDNCRAFFPHGELVTFSQSEAGFSGGAFTIGNEVFHPFARTGNN